MASELVHMMEWDEAGTRTSSIFAAGWYAEPPEHTTWMSPMYYTFNGRCYLEGALIWTNADDYSGAYASDTPAGPLIAAGGLPAEVRPTVNTRVKLIVDHQTSGEYGGIDYYEADVRPDGSMVLVPRDDTERVVPTANRLATLLLNRASWPIALRETVSASLVPLQPVFEAQDEDFEGDGAYLVTGGGRVRGRGSITVTGENGASAIADPLPEETRPHVWIFGEALYKVPLSTADDRWWVSQALAWSSGYENWLLQQRIPDENAWLDHDLDVEAEPWIGTGLTWEDVTVSLDSPLTIAGEVTDPEVGETATAEDVHGLSVRLDQPNALSTTDETIGAGLLLAGTDLPIPPLPPGPPSFYMARYRRNPANPAQFRFEIVQVKEGVLTVLANSSYTTIAPANSGLSYDFGFTYQRLKSNDDVRLTLTYRPAGLTFTLAKDIDAADALPPGKAGFFADTVEFTSWKRGSGGALPVEDFGYPPLGTTFLLDGAGWYGGVDVLRGSVLLGVGGLGVVPAGKVAGQAALAMRVGKADTL